MPDPKRTSTTELAEQLRIDRSTSDVAAIDHKALSALAAHIRGREDFSQYDRAKWDDPLFWNVEAGPSDRSQYFTVGNSINFRFWTAAQGHIKPAKGVIRGTELRGSMYMWRSLRVCLEESRFPILDAGRLEQLSEEEFDRIFADDSGFNPLAIARADRIANLRDLGMRLRRNWGGHFFTLVEASNHSLAEFVNQSQRFRAFDDPNLKLIMVNAILHSGSGIVEFDSDPLPGIDYHLLRHLLRHGILRPCPDVLEKIKRGEILGSDEGIELRRVALNAFIEISRQSGISGEILDNKWWWNRQKCRDTAPVCLEASSAKECPFFGPCAQLTALRFPLEETRYY